ncbi:hypothetical protein COW53_08700 [bacterium CG17_big_fil_post_rev_8_21_14_2_50_64_8]|nr:MAG: hypothetical protein COW53_08700 [bacterium CG17_big_fil_post_rev_8_21_14_2_50_64_8]PJA76933.1 MAG: hypothetical protein CO151_01020 [bacterium CG_4_9_14_3_um_filter_65_15]
MDKTMEMVRSIEKVARRRGLFRTEAYLFVLEALERAMIERDVPGHISGEELLDVVRALGAERYGVMAGDVFNDWGVRCTLDFGRVVFHLVEDGLLRKQPHDNLTDFLDRFDFQEAFSLKVFQGRS